MSNAVPFRYIAQALFGGPRGSGRTHKMLMEAPQGATILTSHPAQSDHILRMLKKVGRTDLRLFEVIRGAGDTQMIGRNLGRCVADHEDLEAWLNDAARIDEERSNAKAALADLSRLRPIDDYHEDMGDVLWWYVNEHGRIEEAPWCGSPLDCGCKIQVEGVTGVTVLIDGIDRWPGYHTHFSPLPTPEIPKSGN